MKSKVSIFWFRRDLRLEDNVGLFHALASGVSVLPIFIFDPTILNDLVDKKDRRVDYIHQALSHINGQLSTWSSKLCTFYANPVTVFKELLEIFDVEAVFCNRDYEPAAIKRDKEIYNFLKTQGIVFKGFKDQVFFDKNDVMKNDGQPYTVYTPYARKWKEKFAEHGCLSVRPDLSKFFKTSFSAIISLDELGFQKTDICFQVPELDSSIINEYDKYRDYPCLNKTTQLGVALRFGTISVRKCIQYASSHNQVWLGELIWREFFMQILYRFPTVVNYAFKKKYDAIQWRNNEEDFMLWCKGKTGYPLVDAGMRELNQTGDMHNRVRMVVASFLCKHLLIDWRWGEAYFAQKLNDYDLSANNGNWQWAAGSGCDAAPYFRVFNPMVQMDKFDKERLYVKKWVPEFGTDSYSKPLVDHAVARARALKIYGEALK